MHGSQAGGGEVGGGVLGEAGGEVCGAEAGDADGVWGGTAEAEPPGAWRGVLDVDDLHVLDAQQLLHAGRLRAPRAWMWTGGHHTELTTTTTTTSAAPSPPGLRASRASVWTRGHLIELSTTTTSAAPSRQRSPCVSSPRRVSNSNNNSSFTPDVSVRLVPGCGHVVITQS